MVSFVFENGALYNVMCHHDMCNPKDYPFTTIIKLNDTFINVFTQSSDITVKQIGLALQQCLNKRHVSNLPYICPLIYIVSTNETRIKSFESTYKKISDFITFYTE